jgi:antitoxin component of MazEF toxin-antitoxin module
MLEYIRKLMRVRKGGSYTVVIAKTLVDILDLKPGNYLSMTLVSHENQKAILIKPISTRTEETPERKINAVT